MKKFLAGVLAFAMAASMMTATVFAEPGDGESQGSSTTIQRDRTGSITIHKYVQENFEEGKGWPNGNTPSSGEALTAPTGAHPLDGVEFTVYKIADADDVLDYYSGDSERIAKAKIPTKDELFNPNDIGDASGGQYVCRKDWYTHKWILDYEGRYGAKGALRYEDCEPAELIGSLTTGQDGQAEGQVKFENLEVGIYLVIETDSPDTVVAPADPFLVSIPLTVNHLNAEGKVTNSEWLYDVHAYPKNTTIVSDDVQIVKNGKIAGTTAQPLAGVKFQLQKKDVVYNEEGGAQSWTWVPVTETKDRFGNTTPLGEKFGEYEGVITSQQDGFVTVSSLSPGEYRFVEIQTLDGYILLDQGGWYFKINDEGKVVWSVIEYPEFDGDTPNFVASATWFEKRDSEGDPSGTHDVTGGIPYAINERPDIDKKVAPKTAPDDYTKKEANYSVGDEIPYQLTILLPQSSYNFNNYNNIESLTFKVSDKPTNMDDDIDSIKIYAYMGDKIYTYVPDDEYVYGDVYMFSYTADGVEINGTTDGGFEIELKGLLLKEYDKIVITYTSKLKKGAEVTSINGNPNEATLEYSSSYSGSGTNKITDRTVVYSGEINIHKKDGANNAPLDGVLFELYEQQEAGTPLGTEIAEGKTTLTMAEAREKGLNNPGTTAYVQIGSTYETKNGGNIRVEGLSDGRYWLVETKTVGNYNLLQGPVEILLELGHVTWMNSEIECTWQDSTKKITEYDESWNLVERDVTVREFVVNKNVIDLEKSTFTQTVNDGKNLGKPIEVINRQGFDLPATGGMGTFIFTFVGIAMMAAAVILFITSKKKEVK